MHIIVDSEPRGVDTQLDLEQARQLLSQTRAKDDDEFRVRPVIELGM
ncbi:hypothetical protein JO965_32115 (plasmid) [Microvirga sp. VF16]|nr:hypothetical protein JO965_32115 [Microvirga sp. VF16]